MSVQNSIRDEQTQQSPNVKIPTSVDAPLKDDVIRQISPTSSTLSAECVLNLNKSGSNNEISESLRTTSSSGMPLVYSTDGEHTTTLTLVEDVSDDSTVQSTALVVIDESQLASVDQNKDLDDPFCWQGNTGPRPESDRVIPVRMAPLLISCSPKPPPTDSVTAHYSSMSPVADSETAHATSMSISRSSISLTSSMKSTTTPTAASIHTRQPRPYTHDGAAYSPFTTSPKSHAFNQLALWVGGSGDIAELRVPGMTEGVEIPASVAQSLISNLPDQTIVKLKESKRLRQKRFLVKMINALTCKESRTLKKIAEEKTMDAAQLLSMSVESKSYSPIVSLSASNIDDVSVKSASPDCKAIPDDSCTPKATTFSSGLSLSGSVGPGSATPLGYTFVNPLCYTPASLSRSTMSPSPFASGTFASAVSITHASDNPWSKLDVEGLTQVVRAHTSPRELLVVKNIDDVSK